MRSSFEPWLERRFDVGVCAHSIAGGRITAEPPHTLLTDPRGGFTGIELTEPPLLDPPSASSSSAPSSAAAPPSRTPATPARSGSTRSYARPRGFHALCEINARHTFGHVARALGRALGARRLGFGAPPPGAPLLVATADVTAWRA